jgi:glycosyltransferase involved in cell wall biosynthesis
VVHICFVNLDYAPQRSSGLGVYGETLVPGLVSCGHSVQVVTRAVADAPTIEELDGVQVLRVPGGRLDWISFARQAAPAVAGLARAHPFDVIHFADVHFAYPYRGPFVATLHQSFRQRLQARGTLPAHAGGVNLVSRLGYYTTARYLAERPALARAQHLVAVSRTTARAYADEYGLNPERISVVRNGIDTERFAPTPSDLRARLGLAEAQVLLFVGFCTARKGLEYLAAALRQLPPQVHLLVIGRWDERYRRQVLAAAGDAAPRVLALGYVPDEDLPAYYTMADLFVMPSLLEGFGLPIAEALACGTAVVTTAAGACPEVVGPGGLVVPAMDANALALAIGSLLQQPERRQALARLGRAWARSALSAEHMVQGHLEAYEGALGSAR